MYSLSHQSVVHILSLGSTHHLPSQPIFSPCVLRAYMLYAPVCLCAFVFHVPMCLCNSFLCTLLPMSIYFTCLCCVNTSGLLIYTAFFEKHTCYTSVLFLVPIFPPWFLCPCFQCFRIFDVLRAQTYLGPKKRMFSKFHWFVFKRLSWTFTISTFYLEMVLLNHIPPTPTHIRFAWREGKKSTYLFLLSYWVNPPLL